MPNYSAAKFGVTCCCELICDVALYAAEREEIGTKLPFLRQ